MNYQSPKLLENGWIECEIEHPEYGWIPFTCDPNDTGALFDTAALFAEMQPHAAPYVPPTQEELDAMAAAASPRQSAVEGSRLKWTWSQAMPYAGRG
jgi:hypothetical protein